MFRRLLIVAVVATFLVALGGYVLPKVTGVVEAASAVVYNSIPDPLPGNVPSLGFEATSTSEFGGQVSLVGTERVNSLIQLP
ncbi:hypothetical protein HYV12_02970 [Candidatus Dojkabacteria bacterium]|nr:hypothetical protein [Candidatus Dojkabacteria bacterium]